MKIERSKNATRNLFWGTLNKIFAIFAQFLIRMILIQALGEAYLGLNSLFTSILSILSLAELGVGSALVFNMYRVIAEEDAEQICALMQFYKVCYRIIGLVILIIGLALMPLMPYLVKSDLPEDINLYILYAINLLGTVSTYFLFAYKNCLLDAHQHTDVISKIASLTGLLQYVLQIVLLLVFKNYYLYAIVVPVVNICNNIFTSWVVDKKYPQYRARGTLDGEQKKGIFAKIRALFVYKVGGVVANSVDNVVISAFLGLVALGKYGNYYLVISTLFSFLVIYYNGMTAGLGNSIATETAEKNFNDFKKLFFVQGWICGFCSVCLLCLFQPFMTLWMGEAMLFDTGVVVCFVLYFYTWKIQDVVNVYKDAGGMWEKDKFRPLLSAVLNLALNIALVRFIGVYGIILSTVASSLFIDLPWSSRVLFKDYFKRDRGIYFGRMALYTLVNVGVAAVTYGVCMLIPLGGALWQQILWFVLKVAVCAVLPNLLYLLCYHRAKEFKQVKEKAENVIKSFLKR